MHDRLLASDLDGTLIPPESTPARTREIGELAEAIRQARAGLALAYVTGRHLESALRGIRDAGLPRPDFLGCEVGTALYRRRGDEYVLDHDYREMMAEALGVDGGRVAGALVSHPEVELQPPAHQGEHKVSFFTRWPVAEHLLEELHTLAGTVGARVGFVVSRDVTTGRGLLDALPAGVAKDRAVRYVADLVGLGREAVVFAGDSGNDEAALLAGFRSVLVGNAEASLAARIRGEAERRGWLARIYFARGWYAAGVLEGCRHFEVLSTTNGNEA